MVIGVIPNFKLIIMGRTSDEEGESSTKVCKSDDIDDRPLKKARYVWQIKGKYHLKKSDEEKHTCYPSKHGLQDECSSLVPPCSNACNSEVNIVETYESNNIHQDASTSSEPLTTSEKPNQVSEVAASDEIGCTKKSNEPEADKPDWSVPQSPGFPITHPSTTWQLRKWQARQVARCFVDNTINRVLEDMGFVPLPVDANDILEEFPMTESENEEGLEDEAVLMAIHRHGLTTEGEKIGSYGENKTSDSVRMTSADIKMCNNISNGTSMSCACSLTSRPVVNAFENLDPFHQRPVFWDQAELNTHKMLHPPLADELKSNELIHQWFSDGGLFSSVISSESSCDSDIKSCNESVVEDQAAAKDVYSSQRKPEVENDSTAKAEDAASQEIPDEANSPSFEHSDFLDKAVAVAIQKKGLSKLSCADYG